MALPARRHAACCSEVEAASEPPPCPEQGHWRSKESAGAAGRQLSSREREDYWNARRGLRAAPERGEIEPGAIRRALADTFVLAVDRGAGHPFRIAGTRVCAAFGRELKGVAFIDLWRQESQPLMRECLHVVAQESVGLVAGARGETAR